MPELSKPIITEILARIPHPATGQNLVASRAVTRIAACDGIVAVGLALDDVPPAQHQPLLAMVDGAIRHEAARLGAELKSLTVEGGHMRGAHTHAPGPGAGSNPPNPPNPPSPAGQAAAAPSAQSSASGIPGVKTVIAVGAGKGGVGKSTIAVNLAVGLARRGYAVGVLDGDIYGPSLPTLLGLHSMQTNILGNMLQPFLVHGVKAMTIGKLVDPEKALIWRGPMAHGAFKQLVEQTQWGELDYMVIDLPPGTGDVALTLAQTLKLAGAVVVCTPQRVAQDDAVRAVRMFQQLGIDVLGVVENMSYFIGDDGKEYDIFGRGGAAGMAQRLGVPYLGAVPINMALRTHSDSGDPTANFTSGGGQLGRELDAVVQQVEAQVALANLRLGANTPVLTIS